MPNYLDDNGDPIAPKGKSGKVYLNDQGEPQYDAGGPQPIGQNEPDTYWGGVGKSAGETASKTAKGIASGFFAPVLHPIDTVSSVINTVAHPIDAVSNLGGFVKRAATEGLDPDEGGQAIGGLLSALVAPRVAPRVIRGAQRVSESVTPYVGPAIAGAAEHIPIVGPMGKGAIRAVRRTRKARMADSLAEDAAGVASRADDAATKAKTLQADVDTRFNAGVQARMARRPTPASEGHLIDLDAPLAWSKGMVDTADGSTISGAEATRRGVTGTPHATAGMDVRALRDAAQARHDALFQQNVGAWNTGGGPALTASERALLAELKKGLPLRMSR